MNFSLFGTRELSVIEYCPELRSVRDRKVSVIEKCP